MKFTGFTNLGFEIPFSDELIISSDEYFILIDNWCEENLNGSYFMIINHAYFELKEDATAFILRWL